MKLLTPLPGFLIGAAAGSGLLSILALVGDSPGGPYVYGFLAIVGGAILPVAQGALADRLGIHHAFFLPAICYLYIIYYALKGSKPTRVPNAQTAI